MANTIAGVNPTRIAQLTLTALKARLPLFSAFTQSFSDEIAVSGDAVVTRFVTLPTVVDFNAAKTTGSNTLTARTTTLFHYAGVPLGFTDKENSLSDVSLYEMFIAPSINMLLQNVFTNVTSLIKNATYLTNVIYSTGTSFNANAVAVMAQNLTSANVSPDNRFLILPPTYAQGLKTDPSVQAAYAYGAGNSIRSGVIPRVHGFDVFETGMSIPTNSENLVGFGCAPQALLLATRVPVLPRNWAGQVMNVQDPDTGLTVQLRDYYDGTVQRTEVCLIYGAQIGIAGNLVAIRSANA